MEHTCFPNAFFAICHTSLVSMLIYYRHKLCYKSDNYNSVRIFFPLYYVKYSPCHKSFQTPSVELNVIYMLCDVQILVLRALFCFQNC